MTTLTHRNIIRDNASQLAYTAATDFNGVRNQEYPLIYNESGSLVSDAGRNIANIEYDKMNNPVRIQFTNGNVTKYVYSAAGEKLRVTYQTAVPNITVATGSTRELTPSETLYTDSIDYRLGGALTLRNGRIDKFLFDEGYCQAERDVYNPGHDDFTFCYYDKDHLGNVRQVTALDGSRGGNVIQRNNYYPFGAEFCDNTASNSVQSRKYNGKEFDRMHGLNTYDYGARQYNPVTARWDRVDPLAHEYYGVSPYVYCMNNPVKFVDPDGRALTDYYTNKGKYLGNDGIDNGKVHIVTDKKDVKIIKQQIKSNGVVTTNQSLSGVSIEKSILQEAANVLQRTIDNGGLREENSLVYNDGSTQKGETGAYPQIVDNTSVASTEFPTLEEGKSDKDVSASIHSHITKVQIKNGMYYPHSAELPSDVDRETFKRFNLNIIVGPIGIFNGNERQNGLVMYDSNTHHLNTFNFKVINKILNH